MTSALSWQNSVSLCPASFSRPNLPLNSRYLLTSYFCIPIPIWWKKYLFLVLILKGLVGLYRTVQLHLLQHYWSGHRLGLLWYWMVCLGNEESSFHHFGDCTQVLLSDSFVDYEGCFISPKGFLPTVVDIMVSWIKSTHSIHFSLLILKMCMFTLAISCLTTSNLPLFMDLKFQVPVQYCSLYHRTWLPSSVTSTTGCCFALAPFLHSFWSYFSTLLQ